jgi:hypothetical protein
MGGDPHHGRYADTPIFRARPSPSVRETRITLYAAPARAVSLRRVKVGPSGCTFPLSDNEYRFLY